MGYCGIKIAGHSETEFKHKKVFAKSQKMLSHKPIFTDVKIEQREQAPSFLWYKRVKIFIIFMFIATILILTTAFSSKMNDLYIDKKPRQPKSISIEESQQAAIMLYNSAKQYYESGAFNFAQEEVTLVLKLYPTNDDALQLMHNILKKQCELKKMYCDNAEEYQRYFADKQDIKDSQ